MKNVLQLNLTINCTFYALYSKMNLDFKVKTDVIISQIYRFNL